MVRYWKPKYKCQCNVCGWTGKRTKVSMYYPCPKCWDYLSGLGVHEKFIHISAIGGQSRTVYRIDDNYLLEKSLREGLDNL